MENKSTEFKPYIPASKVTPELTVTSIVMGILLAIIFGAANAYLGLRVGMTVSASIPAAVIAMGVIRVLLKKNSILESNLVQTIGSAGESLAAGTIFTLPALFLWAKDGVTDKPGIIEITLISLIGGLLGIFFMVPLRNALIVKEHGTLPYPEGTACAEILLAGENGGANASTVFAGMGFAAIFKFIIDGLKAVPGEIAFKVKGYAGEFGTQIYPAVMSVGYICGFRISSYMFSGGVLSWLVLIPLIVLFGENVIMYPSTEQTIGEIYAASGASGIWSSYIRYIGAGALAAGGIISLIKSLPLIINTFMGALKSMKGAGSAGSLRTEQDLNMKIVLIVIAVLTLLVWLVPAIPISLIGAIIVGNGLPQVCTERVILKDYFDEEGKGFDYAYKYPGVNKVFQAAGRVIRTAEDVGIVVLLEARFLEPAYQRLFPREWQYYTVVNEMNVGEAVAEFWEKHK